MNSKSNIKNYFIIIQFSACCNCWRGLTIAYSYLNASAGSMREAFLAGNIPDVTPVMKVIVRIIKNPKKSSEENENNPLMPKFAAAMPMK
jgi:hypothetical protein